MIQDDDLKMERAESPSEYMPTSVKMDSVILCNLCGQNFSKISNCNRHLKMVHKITPSGEQDESTKFKFCCELCEKEFTRSDNLQSHINNVHVSDRSRLIKCSLCNYETVYAHNFKRHVTTCHKGNCVTKGMLCLLCGKKFSKTNNYNRHMKCVHNVINDLEPDESTQLKICCIYCNKAFTRSDNLQIHISSIHLFQSFKHKCTLCNYETVYQSNLRRHTTKCHVKTTTTLNSDSQHTTESKLNNVLYKCSLCTAQYSCIKNLRYHERKSHALGKCKDVSRKCPLCDFVSHTRNTDAIFKHFENVHSIVIELEHHQFDSIDNFNTWKLEVEKGTNTKYKLIYKTQRRISYQCNRSGHYKGILNVPNTQLKMIRSCKVNGFCPAVMKVELDEGCVKVRHVPVHMCY